MSATKRGLTIGQLREAVYEVEKAFASFETTPTEGDAELLSAQAAGALVHALGMTLIQIAQELNELKVAVVGIGKQLEFQASEDRKPFIH